MSRVAVGFEGSGVRPLDLDFARARSSVAGGRLSARGRRARLGLFLALTFLWTGVIFWRLYTLQISKNEKWRQWASRQHDAEVTLSSERGPIYDRNGKMLAISVPAGSVYARPGSIEDKRAAADKLAAVLGGNRREIEKRLEQNKSFVWIQRQVPRVFAEKAAALGLPGVGYFVEARRSYPYNQVASTVIGKVGVDGQGLSGIERIFNEALEGEHVHTAVSRDALGNFIQVESSGGTALEPPRGTPMRLTIDADLSIIMDEELEAGREAANAHAAMAVMVDAESGEILALSQAPTINFNSSEGQASAALKNLIAETVFEPGSIMKPLVAAAALDAKVVRPEDPINCEHGHFLFAGHRIKDVHPSDTIPFFDVVVRSSNIGMTKIGMRLGANKLYAALRNFGIGEDSRLNLPGETRGILRPVEKWAKIDVATHSFGQGVAVTPLQMVRAMSAIANGGTLPTLSLVQNAEPAVGRRVLSEKTSKTVREMLYGVVEDKHGTGQKALIPGLRVGGKTGTAQKPRKDGRGYSPGDYIASFVGFADGSAIGVPRKLTLLVMIDEARVPVIYGGTLAAPVFQKIMKRSMEFLSTREALTPAGGSSRPYRDEMREVAREPVLMRASLRE